MSKATLDPLHFYSTPSNECKPPLVYMLIQLQKAFFTFKIITVIIVNSGYFTYIYKVAFVCAFVSYDCCTKFEKIKNPLKHLTKKIVGLKNMIDFFGQRTILSLFRWLIMFYINFN